MAHETFHAIPSVARLISDLIGDLRTLVQQHVQLMRHEVAAEVAKDDGGKGSGGKEGGGWFESLKNMFSKKSEEPVVEAEKPAGGWRPPGWDRGKKTGWGDGDVPPGLRDKETAGVDFDDHYENEDRENPGRQHGKKNKKGK